MTVLIAILSIIVVYIIFKTSVFIKLKNDFKKSVSEKYPKITIIDNSTLSDTIIIKTPELIIKFKFSENLLFSNKYHINIEHISKVCKENFKIFTKHYAVNNPTPIFFIKNTPILFTEKENKNIISPHIKDLFAELMLAGIKNKEKFKLQIEIFDDTLNAEIENIPPQNKYLIFIFDLLKQIAQDTFTDEKKGNVKEISKYESKIFQTHYLTYLKSSVSILILVSIVSLLIIFYFYFEEKNMYKKQLSFSGIVEDKKNINEKYYIFIPEKIEINKNDFLKIKKGDTVIKNKGETEIKIIHNLKNNTKNEDILNIIGE